MKNIMSVFIFFLFASTPVLSEELLQIERVGYSDHANASEAKRIIVRDVTEEVSKEYILHLIGEDKFKRNQAVLKNQVIQNSGKYIPFLKTKDFHYEGNKAAMTVVLSVSLSSLRQVLLDHGMLYESEELPTVAQFVRVSDRINTAVFEWWQSPGPQGESPNGYLRRLSVAFERVAKTELANGGFYLLPSAEQDHFHFFGTRTKRNWDEKELLSAASELKSDILLGGELSLVGQKGQSEEMRLRVNLHAKYNSNGRMIAEVSREYRLNDSALENVSANTELIGQIEKAMADLRGQLLKVWQKGTFGTSLYRITLVGPADFKLIQNFKQRISRDGRQVMALRERLFAPGEVVFEADISGNPGEVTRILSAMKFEGFHLKLVEAQAAGAVFEAAAH